jgi:hypothetical protein
MMMVVMMVMVVVMMVTIMPRMRRGGERRHGHRESQRQRRDQSLRHVFPLLEQRGRPAGTTPYNAAADMNKSRMARRGRLT